MFTATKDGIGDHHCVWWTDDLGVRISTVGGCPWATLAMMAGLAIDRRKWLQASGLV